MPVKVPSQLAAAAGQKILAFAADGHHLRRRPPVAALVLEDHLGAAANDVGVERASQATIRRDQQHADGLHLALDQQRMQRAAAVGASAPSSATSARIASAYGRAAVTRICARRSREAATSSMALVILAVFRIHECGGGYRGARAWSLDDDLLLELVDRRP